MPSIYNFTLSLYNNNGQLLGSKTVNNITIKSNFHTIAKGTLFDVIPDPNTPTEPIKKDNSFSITVNENFSGDDILINF